MSDTNTFYIYAGHSDPPHYSPWKFIPDTPEELRRAIEDGYTAVSTMSFAYEPKEGKPEPVRRGSLFLDFDSKADPAIAVDMAKMFVERLAERYLVDPECLRYWMSGGKGCHIEIPAAIYGGEAGHPDLPQIQKDMLMFLGRYDFHYPKFCEVLDFKIYCQGKGKLLRLPNIKRHDGRYKVPVSAWEFFNLDYPALERLTLAPRRDFEPGTHEPVQSPRLTELYDIAVGWRRDFSNGSRPVSGIEALFNCVFISHCYENQATLPEPYWWAMVSILATFGDLGRQTAHLFSRGYPGYTFEETELKIKQRSGHGPITCEYIKGLGFDCGKRCGVRSPADLWKYKRSEETRLAMDFVLKEDGVYRQSGNGNGEAIKICSPMKVLGKMRNPEGAGWARLVEIATPDGRRKEVCVFMRDMKGRGDNLIGELQDHGLEPCHGQKIAQYLMEYIMNSAPRDLLLLCVQQIGWLDDAYVLPDAVFGNELKEKIHFQTEGTDNLHQAAGTLEEWQEQVGGYCQGNSLLELLLSYALTGPLLKLVGLEGGGLHVYGSSSSGKTTAAIVAGSVCGGGGQRGFLRQWRATHNALESVATLHNDNLLILDEISQANPDTVSQVAYMLANGQGKDRLRNDASRRTTYRWLLNFLSTGEQTINDKIQEQQGRGFTLAGQEVRVIDLPIDGFGDGQTFQNLHGLPDSAKFSEYLSGKARQYYGNPLRAFLEKLCANITEHRAQVERDMEAFVAEFCPVEASGQVRRVASKFGLIAAAGELGIAFGVLPFEAGASKKAAADWFNIWLSRRNGLGDLEMIRAIGRIQEHLASHSDSASYLDLDSPGSNRPYQINGFTWKDGDRKYVLILTSVFNCLTKGTNQKALIEELDRRGYLARNKNGNLMETKSVNGESKRGVVLIPSAWEGEPTPEELEEEARMAKTNMEELFSD